MSIVASSLPNAGATFRDYLSESDPDRAEKDRASLETQRLRIADLLREYEKLQPGQSGMFTTMRILYAVRKGVI